MRPADVHRGALSALIRTVVDQAPLADSYDHGERHWIRVAWAGKRLLDDGVAADPLVILLFALFHDSRRINEYEDPEHGRRGGALADELVPEAMVTPAQRAALVAACEVHTDLDSSPDVTIGACLDSDRLNLWRVGKVPDPRFLSTDQARRPERIEWARTIHHDLELDWDDVLNAYGVGGGGRRSSSNLRVVRGDITQMDVDAIVNAANHELSGGAGVNGAIHRAGGPSILAECRLIRQQERYRHGVPTGEAVHTGAGDLPARWVIHTVGPIYGRDPNPEQLLANCYINSLELAQTLRARTIAFPAISTGIFGYPIEEAAQVAVGTIAASGTGLEVLLVAFDGETHAALSRELGTLT